MEFKKIPLTFVCKVLVDFKDVIIAFHLLAKFEDFSSYGALELHHCSFHKNLTPDISTAFLY